VMLVETDDSLKYLLIDLNSVLMLSDIQFKLVTSESYILDDSMKHKRQTCLEVA